MIGLISLAVTAYFVVGLVLYGTVCGKDLTENGSVFSLCFMMLFWPIITAACMITHGIIMIIEFGSKLRKKERDLTNMEVRAIQEIFYQIGIRENKYVHKELKVLLELFKLVREADLGADSLYHINNYLDRLVHWMPLSEVTEKDFDDNRNIGPKDPKGSTQCYRCTSLFKNENGTYSSTERVRCYDNDNRNTSYHAGYITRTIDEIYPLTLPYYPIDVPEVKVYCSDFLLYAENGDFDTVRVHEIVGLPDGMWEEIMDKDGGIFFAEKNGVMERISYNEWNVRWEKYTTERIPLRSGRYPWATPIGGYFDGDTLDTMMDNRQEERN